MCSERGLKIFYWTVVEDADRMPLEATSWPQVYEKLRECGVSGFITDFAQNCNQYF